MNSKIVILDDSVILYQHYINNEDWESVMAFPRGGLTYLIKNNNIKFYAYIDYFYRNCLMTMDLPLYIVDEELGIDGEYDDIEELTEILNRIFPALNGDVDLTPYLKKREAEETYQPIGDYFDDVEYDSSGKTIDFYSDGTLVDSIDATDFIKDGMVDSVDLVELSGDTYLHIVFNTDAGKEDIYLNLGDLFNADNYYTKDESDARFQPTGNYLTKESGDTIYQPIGDYLSGNALSGYATEQWVENKNYLTEHQPLKTINGQVISGTGNIEIDCSGGTVDAYTKAESDARFQPIGNYQPAGDYALKSEIPSLSGYATEQWVLNKHYINQIKTINGQSLSGSGNIEISTSGGSVTVDDHLDSSSTNPVQNKVITGALNGKLDASAYTAPVQSDWNATSGLAFIKNKPTIPTVPTNVSAFNNDAGYITSAATVFNNYYTTGNTYNKTQVDNYITNLQNQINGLIESYSECCTGMSLSGTAVIYTTSTTQLVDIGPWREIEVFASTAKTVYPAAVGNDTFSLGVKGQVPCTFKLIDGITSLGAIGDGWHSIFALKYQFNGGFTKIGQGCFTGSTSLQVLDFPSTLTEIRDRAFDGCTALKSLIFRSATPPTLYTPGQTNALDTLYSVNTSFKIYVPSANVNAYKAATGWSTYANLIQAIP